MNAIIYITHEVNGTGKRVRDPLLDVSREPLWGKFLLKECLCWQGRVPYWGRECELVIWP